MCIRGEGTVIYISPMAIASPWKYGMPIFVCRSTFLRPFSLSVPPTFLCRSNERTNFLTCRTLFPDARRHGERSDCIRLILSITNGLHLHAVATLHPYPWDLLGALHPFCHLASTQRVPVYTTCSAHAHTCTQTVHRGQGALPLQLNLPPHGANSPILCLC